jgi:uncharacterized protein YceH (UPF0502 family)
LPLLSHQVLVPAKKRKNASLILSSNHKTNYLPFILLVFSSINSYIKIESTKNCVKDWKCKKSRGTILTRYARRMDTSGLRSLSLLEKTRAIMMALLADGRTLGPFFLTGQRKFQLLPLEALSRNYVNNIKEIWIFFYIHI